MAWEWAPPAATTIAAILGVSGTFIAGERIRQSGLRQAREQRRQQRLEVAYIEVLTLTERVSHWVALTLPILDDGTTAPALPDPPDQARSTALLKAHGSKEVDQLFWEWRKAVQEFIGAVNVIRAVKADKVRGAGDSGIKVHDLYVKLEERLRPAERRARNELAAWMAGELRGETIKALTKAQHRRQIARQSVARDRQE